MSSPGVPEPLDVLCRQALPEPQWMIPGILPQGVTLLSGAQGSGKSGLALMFALAIARGTVVLGREPVLPGEVLFLDLEQSKHALLSRVNRLLQGREVPHSLEWAGSWPPSQRGGLADIEDWLEAHYQPRLVVIDTLDALHPLNARMVGNFSGHTPLIMPLQMMAAAYRIAILVLHHQEGACAPVGMAAMLDCVMEINLPYEERPRTVLHIAGKSMEERDILLAPERGKKQWRL